MATTSGLSYDALGDMNIGDVLDYVYTWTEFKNPDNQPTARNATMRDIEAFANG